MDMYSLCQERTLKICKRLIIQSFSYSLSTSPPPPPPLQDAIAAESFYPEVRQLNKGDFTSAYDSSPLKLEGEFSLGGQEHFYMETNCCLAVPNGERDEMEIFSSTQWANGVQSMAAEALGIPANRISVRVKRVG